MIVLPELEARQLASPMGRASPITKLAVGFGWLAILVLVPEPRPAVVVLAGSIGIALVLGRVPVGRFVRAWAPFGIAALAVVAVNTLLGAANSDLTRTELARIGPFRVTEAAAATGLAIGLRLLSLAGAGVAFAQTTEATTLADGLVQQLRVPDRFAYGALAAYQAVPRLAIDLQVLRESRRIRGLGGPTLPRLVLPLLVLAVRRAARMAVAMDARGFDSGTPRSRFRELRWGWSDVIVAGWGLLAGVIALAVR